MLFLLSIVMGECTAKLDFARSIDDACAYAYVDAIFVSCGAVVLIQHQDPGVSIHFGKLVIILVVVVRRQHSSQLVVGEAKNLFCWLPSDDFLWSKVHGSDPF